MDYSHDFESYCGLLVEQVKAAEHTAEVAVLKMADDLNKMIDAVAPLRENAEHGGAVESMMTFARSVMAQIQHQDLVRQQLECVRYGIGAIQCESLNDLQDRDLSVDGFRDMFDELESRYVMPRQESAHGAAVAGQAQYCPRSPEVEFF